MAVLVDSERGERSAALDAPAPPQPAPEQARTTAVHQGTWLLGGGMRTALLAVITVLTAVLLLRPTVNPSEQLFVAAAATVSTGMSAQAGVLSSSGGYLPGTGIVLVTSMDGVESTALVDLLATAIQASAATIADLPDGEALSWQVTLTAAGTPETYLLRVAANAAADPGSWVVVPVSGDTAPELAATAQATTTTPQAAASLATAPAAIPAPEPAPSGTHRTFDFATEAATFAPLTGTWTVADGTYRQTDSAGYDFISSLTEASPAAYTVSVRLRGIDNTVNGGLILGQPALGAPNGATIVDLAGADFVRWGEYDSTGSYKFVGGAALSGSQVASDWHTLSVTVTAGKTTVSWNGTEVGSFPAVPAGYLGLVTSQSAVAFDDLTVTS